MNDKIVDGSVMEIENAVIPWVDFSGVQGPYKAAGVRYFGVKIGEDSPENEAALKAVGWKVRRFEFKHQPSWGLVLTVFLAEPPAFPSLTISEEEMASFPEKAQASRAEELTGKTLVIYGKKWEYRGKEGLRAYLGNIR